MGSQQKLILTNFHALKKAHTKNIQLKITGHNIKLKYSILVCLRSATTKTATSKNGNNESEIGGCTDKS